MRIDPIDIDTTERSRCSRDLYRTQVLRNISGRLIGCSGKHNAGEVKRAICQVPQDIDKSYPVLFLILVIIL